MATLHLIVSTKTGHGKPLIMPQLFAKACEKLGVALVVHDMRTTSLATLQPLGKGDMVYRAVSGRDAVHAERLLAGPDVATFRTEWIATYNERHCSYLSHERVGIPVIPSVSFIPESGEAVAAVAERLGGFPIVVKVLGGSHGVGVIRVDSLLSLQSLLDYLRAHRAAVLIRKYIPHEYYARLVVVGDRVVASHVTFNHGDDFRTNSGDTSQRKREARVFPEDVQAMAVKAVQTLGLECGGVDLLFDAEGKAYVAEVNFPNDFRFTQEATGIDIAEAMVRHLMQKAQ